MEIWALHKGSGLYVSNIGNVKTSGGRELKKHKSNDHYRVSYRARWWWIARLEAEAFMPFHDEKKMQVDHINGDGYDNRLENLEWVTPQENARRAGAMGRLGCGCKKRAVIAIKGDRYLYFESQAAAGRALGIPDKGINKAVRGKGRHTTHGYTFRYAEEV